MTFRQLEENPVKVATPAGSREIPKYEIRLTNKGHKVIKEVGKINIYDRIQDGKEECDVLEINRRAMAGDINAIAKLQNSKAKYGDMTTMPSTLLEAKQLMIDAEKTFYQLPLEIRNEFNNNPDEFLAGTQNGKIKEVFEKHGAVDKPLPNQVTIQETNKEETL